MESVAMAMAIAMVMAMVGKNENSGLTWRNERMGVTSTFSPVRKST